MTQSAYQPCLMKTLISNEYARLFYAKVQKTE